MNQRPRAFALTLGLGPPKEASIDLLSGAGASAGVLSSTLGVARCGRSTGCVLCGPCRLLCWGGRYPVGVSISSSVSASDSVDMLQEEETPEGRAPPTGDTHRGGGGAPQGTPPQEGRATQGTHIEHTQTLET